jgi:hypothetical protein
METFAAMLVVLFQLFFGWCHDGDAGEPPAPSCQADGGC